MPALLVSTVPWLQFFSNRMGASELAVMSCNTLDLPTVHMFSLFIHKTSQKAHVLNTCCIVGRSRYCMNNMDYDYERGWVRLMFGFRC